MARTYTVKMQQDAFPLRAALQTTIKTLGYPLTLEDDYVPFVSSGYLPCTLDGEDAGLFIRFFSPDQMGDNTADNDAAVSLQWSGDPREKATVMIVATALASAFSAKVLDENNIEQALTALTTMTKNTLSSLDTFI